MSTKTVDIPKPQDGDILYDTSEKVFPDIKAEPGQKAFVFIHSVPFEGSVALVNLKTSTRLVRKGFDVNIVLYGPAVLLASATRGYPAVGTEGFPEDDLIEGVKAFNPLDVLDSALYAWKEKAFQLNTWTV
jgi:hypothetical protein